MHGDSKGGGRKTMRIGQEKDEMEEGKMNFIPTQRDRKKFNYVLKRE